VDWGIHHIDIIRTIMDFEMPASFQTNGALSELDGKITTPDTLNATMNFEECPVIWQHRLWGSGDLNPQFNNGVFFYGEQGTLFASDRKLVLMPAGKNQEQLSEEIKTEEMQENHVADFLTCCESQKSRSLKL
jgi:predicted dehydrogenase